MAATSFEITMWVQDDDFAGAVAALIVSVAHEAGGTTAQCTAFADRVEAAVRESLPALEPNHELPVLVRRTAGPVEVVVGGRTLTLDL